MSATDELRRLLDERGVKHIDYGGEDHEDDVGTPTTWWYNDQGECAAVARDDNRLTVEFKATPAQTIAATLGAGTCRNDAPFYIDFLCSKCGFVHYHSDENDSESGNEWHFCPNCGRRIEVGK